jgi:type IV pilus assembly protein PilN
MIRINLLGQMRPKAARRPVDTGAAMPLLFVVAGVVFAAAILFYVYHSYSTQLNAENARIKQLQAQKTELEAIKQQVKTFEDQKKTLQQRVDTIEQLQKDRTGGQELLDEVANTVSRAENLWLTSMSKKGSVVTFDGASASINSVANFITALKRSGYFQKIEIKETRQDDKTSAVQTFLFTITAEIASSGPPSATATPAKSAAPAAAPAKKG